MKRYQTIWVVEAKWSESHYDSWGATVGVGLTREDGRKALKEWQQRNPSDFFRLMKYSA